MDLKRPNMIPIPLGKAGKPANIFLRDRINISSDSRRLSLPSILWSKFNQLPYASYFISDNNLVIRLRPVKEGANYSKFVRVFTGGRPEFKMGRLLGSFVNSGKYLYTIEDDLIIIEDCINKAAFMNHIKLQTNNFKLQ